MAITFLDVDKLADAIQAAVKASDPSIGDPTDKSALCKNLTDVLPHGLTFDVKGLVYTPGTFATVPVVLDNSNGLLPNVSDVTLKYSYTDTAAVSNSATNVVKHGTTDEISASASFDLASVGGSHSMSVQYTFSYEKEETRTHSQTTTSELTIHPQVPKGKIYEALVVATVHSIEVPYTADVTVTGTVGYVIQTTDSSGNLTGEELDVPVYVAFDWISKFGTAGQDSALYSGLDGKDGALRVTGKLSASQAVDFRAQVFDVTNAGTSARSAVPAGELIDDIPVAAQPRPT